MATATKFDLYTSFTMDGCDWMVTKRNRIPGNGIVITIERMPRSVAEYEMLKKEPETDFHKLSHLQQMRRSGEIYNILNPRN